MKKLFLHMPKCAGTSVLRILEASASASLRLDYDSFFKIPRSERNSALIDVLLHPWDVEAGKVVYGHFFPIKYIGGRNRTDFKLVTILRDPISRLKSHYAFWKAGDYSDHHVWRKMKAQNWSFEDFAFSDEMRNIYTQYFTGISLGSVDYIGLFETMDRSVVGCLTTLGIAVEAKMSLPRERVTARSEPGDLSEEVARKLREHHADDYLMYEFAKKKFHAAP